MKPIFRVMPRAILQKPLIGAWVKRAGVYPVHDANLVVIDLDALDQGADDGPPGLPIDLLQPLLDGPGEVLQPADRRAQVGLVPLLARGRLLLGRQLRHPLLGPARKPLPAATVQGGRALTPGQLGQSSRS
jgi:hypothetical protein